MGMRLHELHASAVHTPLGLLPTAATFDLAAALSGSRSLARTGATLWWAGSLSAVFAGIAGLAASQEVKAYEKTTHDAMLVHGLANTGVTVVALGMSVWRARHRPTLLSTLVGFGAVAATFWTAFLGGEIVYARGVGVKPAGGVADSPELLSREAPARLVRDAARGLGWALREGARFLRAPSNVMEVSR